MMSKLDSLIGMIDPFAGLRIEAALMAFDGYQFPQLMENKNADEYMLEWWSVENYLDETKKIYLLFTYHKLKRDLKMYYELTSTEESKR